MGDIFLLPIQVCSAVVECAKKKDFWRFNGCLRPELGTSGEMHEAEQQADSLQGPEDTEG